MFKQIVLVVAAALAFGPTVSAQNTWYVDDDTCPGVGDGSMGTPFCSIQDAIDIASDTDEIIVAQGLYLESIDFLGKAILVRSTNPTDPLVVLATIIDGSTSNAFHVVQCISGEGPNTVLSGFTITGGDASGLGGNDVLGGGMFNENSSPTVTCCVFFNNAADNQGGGMHNLGGAPMVSNCEFIGNSSSFGGGMMNLSASTTVNRCVFRNNSSSIWAGGLLISGGAVVVTDCRFERNVTAGSGGGMYIFAASPLIKKCVFIANTAETGGGAMYNASAPTISECTITSNVVNAGTGGGMLNGVSDSPGVIGSTICGNLPDQIDGGAITDGGGNFIGDLCPPPKNAATGACCVSGNCMALNATDCGLIGGIYQGDDTDCGLVVCPVACAADITGPMDGPPDGIVGVLDFLKVLADWGACP